jgi:hypothetical protein
MEVEPTSQPWLESAVIDCPGNAAHVQAARRRAKRQLHHLSGCRDSCPAIQRGDGGTSLAVGTAAPPSSVATAAPLWLSGQLPCQRDDGGTSLAVETAAPPAWRRRRFSGCREQLHRHPLLCRRRSKGRHRGKREGGVAVEGVAEARRGGQIQ